MEQMNVMNLLAAFMTDNTTLQLVSDGSKIVDLVTIPEAAAEIFRLVWLLHTIGTGRQTLQHNVPNEHLPSTQLPPLPKDGGLHTSYMMHATANSVVSPELGSAAPASAVAPRLKKFTTFSNLSPLVATQAQKSFQEATTTTTQNTDMTEYTALTMIRRGLPLLALNMTSWKPECMRPLALALRFNDTIKAVVAEDAPELGPHLGIFGKMLENNTSVLKLKFSNCRIQPQACVGFGNAMKSNRFCALADLDLRMNHVDDEAAIALSAAFRSKPNSLVKLVLSSCQINEKGIEYLL